MARSKKRRKAGAAQTGKKIAWGGGSGRGTGRLNLVIAAVVALVVAGGLAYWLQALLAERAFLELAAEGRARLETVVTEPNLGRRHLEPGEGHRYADPFPTSGPHARTWATPGRYDRPPSPLLVVHALEHGNVVIYYDTPDAEVRKTLERWTGLYQGQWDGLLLVRTPGLGSDLVLTAWRKELRLQDFDAPLAAAFIDAYRGRGPEHPVR